jgi:uncharacterized membrane protein YphA (DoxX/SURF4 family)
MGFPRGVAGFALALLRLSVAAKLLTTGGPAALDQPWWLVLQVTLAVMLLLGVLTPVLALICCGAQIAVTFAAPWTGSAENWLTVMVPIIDPVVLLLLGPGAYSLDARAFGRRLLVLSTSPDGP